MRIGVVGCGGISHAHGEAAKKVPEFEFAACCDLRPEAARAWAEEYGGTAYGECAEMLEREELDGVLVATWPTEHRANVEQCLEAGVRHILCEKALTLTGREARLLWERARQAGATLMEGFMYRHHPAIRRAEGLVAGGEIGEVDSVRACFSAHDPEVQAMLEALRQIRFARFHLELEAVDRLKLPPYKGSTFRGAFGNTFKQLVCVKRDLECATCLIQRQCVYYYVFETPYQGEPARGYTFAPHPFVIEPPEETREIYEPGEVLRVGLVLVGKALDYLPYFIYAFEEMGHRGLGQGRGKAALKRVWAGEGLIYNAGEGRLDTGYLVCAGPRAVSSREDRVRLCLQTPTRLKDGGRLSGDLDFSLLVRSLLRRSSDLARCHCGAELGLDYRDWIDRAGRVRTAESHLRWHDWERYSHRQGTKMQMGGVVGEVRYEGEIRSFLPLLSLGADLHVGKGTGFGLGRYEIG